MSSRDEKAFKILLERHIPVLIAYLAGKTRGPAETEDLVQDVLLAAVAQREDLRDIRSFSPWLMAIARNKLNYSYRKRERERRVFEERPGSSLTDVDRHIEAADPAFGPAQHAQSKELAEMVSKALGRLKEKYRIVLGLSLQQNYSLVEIAELLGLKHSTVRMQFRRGLALLRKDLQRHGISIGG